MPSFDLEVQVNASPEKTFHVFSDVTMAQERIPAITAVEMLTTGPVQAGTRWKESRTIFGKDATEEMWISEFHPPHRYSVACDSCGVHFESIFDFTPHEQGTRVEFTQKVHSQSLMAKLMQPLGWLMMGSMKKMLMGDLEALKKAAESD